MAQVLLAIAQVMARTYGFAVSAEQGRGLCVEIPEGVTPPIFINHDLLQSDLAHQMDSYVLRANSSAQFVLGCLTGQKQARRYESLRLGLNLEKGAHANLLIMSDELTKDSKVDLNAKMGEGAKLHLQIISLHDQPNISVHLDAGPNVDFVVDEVGIEAETKLKISGSSPAGFERHYAMLKTPWTNDCEALLAKFPMEYATELRLRCGV